MNENQTGCRNWGIDLLRIVAMYMIVVMHFLGEGGVREAAAGMNHNVAWLFEAACFCAVDCYALISGMVNYSKRIRQQDRIMKLWTQVVFYTVGAFLICLLFRVICFNACDALYAVLPIATSHYWYVSSYMGLLLLMPYLNILVETLDRKKTMRMLAILFLAFSWYSTFALRIGDPFELSAGFSLIWLILLYLAGACVKRFALLSQPPSCVLILTLCFCVCFTWLWKILVPEWLSPSWLFSYTSPTVLIPAVCLVELFQRIRFSGRRTISIINAIAPTTLGVYLIHENKLIRTLLIDRFIWIGTVDIWLFPICIVVIPAILFAVCCSIEKARRMLFKLFRIDNLTARFSDFIVARCKRVRLFRE